MRQRLVERLAHRADAHDAARARAQLLGVALHRAPLAEHAPRVAEQLVANSEAIDAELIAVQGSPADIGGYYRPDDALASAVMTPSATFNAALARLAD